MKDGDELQQVLDRLVEGNFTAEDVEALKRFYLAGRIVLSTDARSVSAGGDISDSVVVAGDRNIIIKGDGAVVVKQILDEGVVTPATTAPRWQLKRIDLVFGATIAGLALLAVRAFFPLMTSPMQSSNVVPSLETGSCGGQPISSTIPAGPAEFDRQFGYTFYDTANSPGLATNAIRALLLDDGGLWVGYGTRSVTGRSGISHVSFDLGGYRIWEYCLSTLGKPIGTHSNAIASAKDGTVWVATDGDGAWRLQRGQWEQFLYDPHANNDAPDPATFALAAVDSNILVGTLSGVTRWKVAGWERILYDKKVDAIALAAKGDVWVGYITDGVSRNPWDSTHAEFNVENGSLSSDQVRGIAIDKSGRVWVATDGGGLNVYEEGGWASIRAGHNGFPSDMVYVVAVDKYNRVWAGTDKGTVYFDGQAWRTYSNLETNAIAFGQVPHESCPPEDSAWDVWLGTNSNGLVSSRLPPQSAVVTDFHVSDVPALVRPGRIFTPTVTVSLEKDYELTQGDFLQALEENSFTANPLVGTAPGVTVRGPQNYGFSFASNPMRAPDQTGSYQSLWRLWQCGRYVGPSIPIDFTVGSQ